MMHASFGTTLLKKTPTNIGLLFLSIRHYWEML